MISIYEEVVIMIATIAKVDKNRINEKTNLFEDLDMDSLIILDFVNQMEETWDFKLSEHPELLDEMETVESLVAYLQYEIGGVE